MTGPWAGYGREHSPDEVGRRESEPESNPYLRGQSARHSADAADPGGADSYWQNPARSNPYLSGSAPQDGPPGHQPSAQNPYLRNPYLPNPYLPNPHDPYRTTGQRPPDSYPQRVYGPAVEYPNATGQPPQPPPGHPPAQSAGQNWGLIAAAIVMVAIVIAAVAILFNRSDSTTATLPTTAPGAGTVGVLPAPPARSAQLPPSVTDDPTTDPATTSSAPPTTSTGAALLAARAAATAWVSAINRDQVGPAQALSCAAVKPKIDLAFVRSVAGSITVTSITIDDQAAARPTGTLFFSYQKTTDTQRKQDHLSLVLEAGRWKVCS